MTANAYEDVCNRMPQPSTFAATGALPHPAPFLLTLAGMDEPLSWPLGAAQAQQIAALYPDTKIIPNADIAIDTRYFQRYDDMLTAIYQDTIEGVVPSSNAEMVLSHMVVDDVGDAESFRLRPTPDDAIRAATFGVLIILLPSLHEGGVLMFTYGDDSLDFDDATPLIDTAYAATYLSTTITSAPITSGRRVALVYRLYFLEGPRYFVPPTLDGTIAELKALGTSPFEKPQRLGIDISVTSDSFESLNITDALIVDALVAAGCFDVGLADLKNSAEDATSKVEALLAHPACNMPAAVRRGCVGTTIQGFLYTAPSGDLNPTSRAIVFWPKRHRACFVNVGRVFAFLENRLSLHEDHDGEDPADANEPEFLGIADTREVVLAAMCVFDPENALLLRRTPSFLVSMEHFLMALNDVELSAVFLSDYITIQHLCPLLEIAPFVYRLLTKHGWEPLCAAMLGLVQRWMTTEADATLLLLTSLAGLNKAEAICLPLQQPFEAELFKRCYHALLATPDLLTKMHMHGRSHVFIEQVLVLEHYVQVTAPQLQEANYMSQRLPLPFVAVIDAYLFQPSAVLQFASSFSPLRDLAVGLVSAMRRQPSLPLAVDVVDGILETLRTPNWRNGYDYLYKAYIDAAAAVLFLASHTRRLDAALFNACVAVWGLALFRAIASVQPQLADTTRLSELALAYIDAVLETLAVETAWPEWLPRPTEEDKDWVQMGAVIFLDVLHLLEQLAPVKMVTVATTWLQALPTTRNALHGHLLPVLARLDEGSPVYRLLAMAAIARWMHLLPLPVVAPAFAIAPPEDLDPDHCQQCNHVHAFYSQADALAISRGRDDLCSTLARIVFEDDARVSVRRHWVIEEGYSIEKLQMAGPNAEWRAYLEQVQIAAHVTAAVEALKDQMAVKHNQDQEKDDAPVAKRVRRA